MNLKKVKMHYIRVKCDGEYKDVIIESNNTFGHRNLKYMRESVLLWAKSCIIGALRDCGFDEEIHPDDIVLSDIEMSYFFGTTEEVIEHFKYCDCEHDVYDNTEDLEIVIQLDNENPCCVSDEIELIGMTNE
jgi:hypothetical protein